MRGAKVLVCEDCGLVQTAYNAVEHERHAPSISSGAGWGNIRHGKGLRLDANAGLLNTYMPSGASKALDIGANRGDFIKWLNVNRPDALIDAIEPDYSIISSYTSNPSVTHIGSRIEDLELAAVSYDFVFCLHTLEHAASASGMLTQARESMRPNGRLLVEVPDLNVINDKLVVEDFFIDKHSFHFDDSTLRRGFAAIGLRIIDQLPTDGRNLNYVLERTDPGEMLSSRVVAQTNIKNIARYVSSLNSNRARLSQVAERITMLASRQKVGIWGASRIFDALVRYGQMRTDDLVVIDDYLSGKVEEMHGAVINSSSILRIEKPQVLVVLAKGSARQIEKLARSFGIKNVVLFDDLFAQVI